MRLLPPDVRQHDEKGDCGRRIDPRARQGTAQRCCEHAYSQRDQIKRDQIFAEQADAGDNAKGNPPAFVARLHQPHQTPAQTQPGQRLYQIRRQKQTDGEIIAAAEDTKPCQPLREPPPAKQAGELRRQCRRGRNGQRGRQPKAHQEVSEQRVRPRSDQRHQRRLIDITPGRTVAADDEVELIAEEPITAIEQKVDCQVRDPARWMAATSPRWISAPNGDHWFAPTMSSSPALRLRLHSAVFGGTVRGVASRMGQAAVQRGPFGHAIGAGRIDLPAAARIASKQACLPQPASQAKAGLPAVAREAGEGWSEERIRTSGPHVPNVVLYQAELLSGPFGRRPYNDAPSPRNMPNARVERCEFRLYGPPPPRFRRYRVRHEPVDGEP